MFVGPAALQLLSSREPYFPITAPLQSTTLRIDMLMVMIDSNMKIPVASEMTLESILMQSLCWIFHIRCYSMVFIMSECLVFLSIFCSSYKLIMLVNVGIG